MYAMLELGARNEVPVLPLYVVSENPATTILDLSATIGIDILALGSTHRTGLVSLLKGNVVTEVAKHLPENIPLIILGEVSTCVGEPGVAPRAAAGEFNQRPLQGLAGLGQRHTRSFF